MSYELIEFDGEFFENIEGKEMVLIKHGGVYHSIDVHGKKTGIVGFVPTNNKSGFIQILIDPEYRGKGLLKQAEDLLVKKYKLKCLLATIEKNNIASIKSHLKAGFKMLGDEETEKLREKGLLDNDKIRLVKYYKPTKKNGVNMYNLVDGCK